MVAHKASNAAIQHIVGVSPDQYSFLKNVLLYAKLQLLSRKLMSY